MRGTLHSIAVCGTQLGIIPAYAGNTWLSDGSRCRPGDHPRVCGEHLVELFRHLAGSGSSPRMRGTLAYFKVERRYYGIIPAYAGNTESSPVP